jgi:hypothetical protein
MAKNITTFSNPSPSEVYPIWDFRFENMPSSNPDLLFPRWMRCPLRHASKAFFSILFVTVIVWVASYVGTQGIHRVQLIGKLLFYFKIEVKYLCTQAK